MSAKEIIAQVRARMDFTKYELDITQCSLDELVAMINTPEEGSMCRAYANSPVAGSAFSQIHEYAIHGGYIRCDTGIKVLVIYTERPRSWSGYEFALLPMERIKHYTRPKPKLVKSKLLSRRARPSCYA